MTLPIQMAVVSDLHIPSEDGEEYVASRCDAIRALRKKRDLDLDYLIVGGDLGASGDPEHVLAASAALRSIADALDVDRDHVVFAPGNHDVNWTDMGASRDSTSDQVWENRFGPMATNELLAGIQGRARGVLHAHPYWCVWEYGDLVVVAYNSANEHAPWRDPAHGVAQQDIILNLKSSLSDLRSDDRARVFLLHHHPYQWSDPIARAADFSILQNAENLLDAVQELRFDLIIHGHKHCPHFETLQLGSGDPIAILGSGSFSAQIPTSLQRYVSNQFHVITVQRRDAETGCMRGSVEHFAYEESTGWIPSHPSFQPDGILIPGHGIERRSRFGQYVLPRELLRMLEPLCTERLRSSGYFSWAEHVVGMNPEFGDLPRKRIIGVLDDLATMTSSRRIGSEPDEDIVLVHNQ